MRTSSTNHKKKSNKGVTILIALFWLGVWELVFRVVNKELLVPSPSQVAARFLQLCTTSAFWRIIAESCARVALGFVIAFIIGGIMGTLSAAFPAVHRVFHPILRIIGTTPVASFIILAVVWLKTGKIPTFITFLMVLPLVWNNIYQGFLNVDKELLEMVEVFDIPFSKQWKTLYLPSLAPYIAASFSTGIAFAWKAGVAAEVIAQPAFSIGRKIHDSRVYLETTDLFAWTVAVILLSFGLEKLVQLIIKRFTEKGADNAKTK